MKGKEEKEEENAHRGIKEDSWRERGCEYKGNVENKTGKVCEVRKRWSR